MEIINLPNSVSQTGGCGCEASRIREQEKWKEYGKKIVYTHLMLF
jgi:hypothetical protein